MNKTVSWLKSNIFLVMVITYFFQMVWWQVRPGIVFTALFVFLWILSIGYILKLRNIASLVFLLFLCCILLTGLNYFSTDANPLLFFHGVQFLVLPMVFFILGISSLEQRSIFILTNIIKANILVCLVGLILYLWMPEFYINYLYNIQPNFNLEYYSLYPRLSSFMGSTAVGTVCAVSIPIVFFLFQKKKFKLGISVAFICVFIVTGFLSFQRSAWVAIIFGLFLSIIYLRRTRLNVNSPNSNKFIMLILFVGFVLLVYSIKTLPDEWVVTRFESITEAASERSSQWQRGLTIVGEKPFGAGIGSTTHRAIILGYRGIPDGNYFRMLSDYGILGFSIFILLVVYSLINSFRVNRYIFICLLVILFQAIGSNIIDFAYTGSIFWFLLGMASNRSVNHIIENGSV